MPPNLSGDDIARVIPAFYARVRDDADIGPFSTPRSTTERTISLVSPHFVLGHAHDRRLHGQPHGGAPQASRHHRSQDVSPDPKHRKRQRRSDLAPLPRSPSPEPSHRRRFCRLHQCCGTQATSRRKVGPTRSNRCRWLTCIIRGSVAMRLSRPGRHHTHNQARLTQGCRPAATAFTCARAGH